jgi:uncharacterized protein
MAEQSSKIRTWLSAWVALSNRRPWVIVLGCLAFAAACGLLASGLAFRGDYVELLPEKAEEVKDLRFVDKRAGGGGYLTVQVTGGDRQTRRKFADAWAPAMEKETEIARYVEYRFDIDFFRSRGLLLLPADKLAALHDDLAARIDYERKHANPLFVDLLDDQPPPTMNEIEERYGSQAPKSEFIESKDGSELYLLVKPMGLVTDLDFTHRMLATARRVADQVLMGYPDLKVAFTGQYVIRIEEDDQMREDIATAASLAGVLALALIFFATRRLTSLVIVSLPVSVGIIFTFGLARVTIGHLNPITGFLAAVLIGLGIEYGVHLTMRYREERTHLEVLPALEATLLGTFNGALTSAFTNAAAFFVLVFAEFSAFRQFGFLASVGVMATVASTYAMGPAVLVISERLFKSEKAPLAPPPQKVTAPDKSTVPSGLVWLFVVVVGGWAIWSLTVARHLSFETDLLRLKGKSPATELDNHIIEQMGIIMTPALVHVETLAQAEQVTRIIDEVNRKAGRGTGIDKAASLNDLVPQDVEARMAGVARIKALFDDLPDSFKKGELAEKTKAFRDLLAVRPWGPDELPMEIRRRFSAISGTGTFVLIFPKYMGYDTRQIDVWADQLNEIVARARAENVPAAVLDGNRIASRILRMVKGDGPYVMFGAAVVVFLMIWVSLRKLTAAMLVAGPLYLGIVCLLGVMWVFDLKLNFYNIVVLPSLLSVAVDNSVHLFHRYHEEGRGSLPHVVKTTGFAAFIATLSNVAGYATLVIAHHEGMRSVAFLATAGVGCTFIGTSLLFPALLLLLERRKNLVAPKITTNQQGT